MGSWIGPTASLLGIGWYFGVCIILGVGIGHWVDSKSGLEPIFTLVGIILGLLVAFVGGLRMLLPVLRRFGDRPPE